MNEISSYTHRSHRLLNMADFYTAETPLSSSSSTSKDSSDESLLNLQSKKKLKLSTSPNETKSNLLADSFLNQNHQFDPSLYDDVHTTLRRTLGNTKLKTRQDVRRFRKFLKRNHDISSMTLIDIDPDTMRRCLIDYLTSIRTRKGLKYDPETLRSYYLSIQRFLKDSNYPYCLRNSPQFAQCRDLIIQMRKEKNQVKSNDCLADENLRMKRERLNLKKFPPVSSISNPKASSIDQQASSSEILLPIVLTKDLLPSSSLPPRKRQQMKYFFEFGSPQDYLFLPKPTTSSSISSNSPPPAILSSDAYSLLIKLTRATIFSSKSSSQIQYLEQLLDQSPACGVHHRLMLTALCHEWTGDIRLVHANLRPELNSFLPHILVLTILLPRYSY